MDVLRTGVAADRVLHVVGIGGDASQQVAAGGPAADAVRRLLVAGLRAGIDDAAGLPAPGNVGALVALQRLGL